MLEYRLFKDVGEQLTYLSNHSTGFGLDAEEVVAVQAPGFFFVTPSRSSITTPSPPSIA
jgi:hypothetical protein